MDTDGHVEALRRELAARLDAADRAVAVSATTLTDRLAHSNGLIEQMRQQSTDFARRVELAALEARVASLEQARSKNEGTATGKQPLASIGMVVVAAVIAAVVGAVAARLAP